MLEPMRTTALALAQVIDLPIRAEFDVSSSTEIVLTV